MCSKAEISAKTNVPPELGAARTMAGVKRAQANATTKDEAFIELPSS
jgi:hypothetical protein